MKNIKYLISLFAIMLMMVVVSCDKQLDLKPQQSIDTETALATSASIETLLVGVYQNMRSASLWGGNFNEFSELTAATTDMHFIGSYAQPEEFFDKEIIADNTYLRGNWNQAYYVNNMINTILSGLEVVNENIRPRIEGEAKLARGWLLFEMTRLYGKQFDFTSPANNNTNLGVPIVLTPTLVAADAINVTRNTVSECYTQAIADLTAAKTLLAPYGQNGTNLSTYAASAVLAKVYLQQGNYAAAATEASRVIEQGGYNLMATPRLAHNNAGNVAEDVFAFQNNTASNVGTLAVMYASLNDAGRGDYEIRDGFLNIFEPGDLRGSYQGPDDMEDSYTHADVSSMYYYGVGGILNFGGTNTIKWGNYYTNLPMIRLAEMYLTRAEANFEAGTSTGATPLADINKIRGRAGLTTPLTSVTRDIIRMERYKELCWEGFRLHDLKRWHINIGSINYDSWAIIMPIPLNELEANPNLQPNPGQLTP
ncbi:MAG: RagB/SusD family nutrient uptake outer membrane protein [Bacteroidetes bacterium]|nr:RagB/SusD family nutrient uptake outer membrane protein [Bacteroidota bacterium]